MSRSIDEQVEELLGTWWKYREQPSSIMFTMGELRTGMRDLLAGKFAEEPLPTVVLPPWALKHSMHNNAALGWRVEASESAQYGWHYWGPFKPTPRAAILAWNAGMRGDK